MKIIIKLLLFFLIIPTQLKAAYWDTLPKGVRSYIYKNINTAGDINTLLGSKGDKTKLSFSKKLDADFINTLPSEINNTFNDIKSKSPEILGKISLGEFSADANASLNVQANAIAYGITDRITFWMAIPYYKASISVKLNQTKKDNIDQIKKELAQSGDNSASIQLIDQVIGHLPSLVNPGVAQSVIVNHFGYDPLGSWSGSGYGDINTGFMYRFTDAKDYGHAILFGLNAPTGREDDPDILQDLAFGDGQWDLHVEYGGGYKFNETFLLESYYKYTYQLPSTKYLRSPESEGLPITSNKDFFREKLGNIHDFSLAGITNLSKSFSLRSEYLLSYRESSKYESSNEVANRVLAQNTHKLTQNLKLALSFSSMDLFTRKKFPIPLTLTVSGNKMLYGINTPQVDLMEVELRLYF